MTSGASATNSAAYPAQRCAVVRGPAVSIRDVAALDPSQLLQPLHEGCDASLPFRIVRGSRSEHPDAPHSLGLLRARRNRPRRGRAAEQRDELAPSHHSITSSAMASRDGGKVSPSDLAILRLISSSNLADCTTGSSAGLAPPKILPL